MTRQTHPVLAIVPARGGSKRLPRKNLVPIGGIPLLGITLLTAHQSGEVDRFVVTTDDEEIAQVATQFHAEVVTRPPELALDHSPTMECVQHVLAVLPGAKTIQTVVVLQPTSPFRTGADIDAALDLYRSGSADVVLSVCETQDHPFHMWHQSEGGILTPYTTLADHSTPRRDLPTLFKANGALYVLSALSAREGRLYAGRITGYVMPTSSSIDIDTASDLAVARALWPNSKVAAANGRGPVSGGQNWTLS